MVDDTIVMYWETSCVIRVRVHARVGVIPYDTKHSNKHVDHQCDEARSRTTVQKGMTSLC